MSQCSSMEVAIVGAGIFGVATALEVRGRGHDVTLFDRGDIPNPEASSTDVAKAIRRTNYPHETYVELAMRAADQWRIWHDRLSQSIYYQTGMLHIVHDVGPHHTRVYETLSRLGKNISRLTETAVRERFPQFTPVDGDAIFYDPWAGYLRSGQAVSDLVQLARDEGVAVRDNIPVQAVDETDSSVRVTAAGENLTCDRGR